MFFCLTYILCCTFYKSTKFFPYTGEPIDICILSLNDVDTKVIQCIYHSHIYCCLQLSISSHRFDIFYFNLFCQASFRKDTLCEHVFHLQPNCFFTQNVIKIRRVIHTNIFCFVLKYAKSASFIENDYSHSCVVIGYEGMYTRQISQNDIFLNSIPP